MARDAGLVLEELLAVTPKGWAFPAGGTLYAATLEAMAGGLADIEALAEAMMAETDPRTATLCLPDFERVLGPDPCGRDFGSLSIEQRRTIAFQRWTSRGGASIPYFVALAAARGVAITVAENRTSQADAVEADFELADEGEQFVWTVQLALLGETLFEADGGAAGDSLYDIMLSDIECDIRRLKPAHTEVAFIYT